jgi:hypothetical protein
VIHSQQYESGFWECAGNPIVMRIYDPEELRHLAVLLDRTGDDYFIGAAACARLRAEDLSDPVNPIGGQL